MTMKITRSPKRVQMLWFVVSLSFVIAATIGTRVGSGQQTVPFENNIPVAPRGLAARPLPDKPI
ncbi:MAG: hypothetical protein EHM89_18905, partial [Acidobacteria bacterium]